MQPMLDDLALPNVQEIRTHDHRVLAEHQPPGKEGSLFQNMGRRPTKLMLWGIAAGADALNFVTRMDDLFYAHEPVPFIGDIIADAEIETVIIANLQWREVAGKPNRFIYLLDLSEFNEPTKPTGTGLDDFIDTDIFDQVLDDLNIGFEFVDLLSQFIPVLTEFNDALQSDGIGALM